MTDYNVALGSQYTLKLRITLSSQSITANTSRVNFYLYAIKNSGSGYYTYSAKPYNWNINGNSGSGAKTYDFTGYTTLLLASGSYTIPHNSDGTKSISVSGYFNPDNAPEMAAATASGTYTLPTIARASTPTVAPTSFDAGTTVAIDMNRASTSFTHTVTYDFGSVSDGAIATGVGADTTWVPPLSLLNEIPTAVSGSGVIRVVTYSGATYIGTKTVGFTLRVPTSVVPTVSSLTASEATTTPAVATLIGAYVQGVSKLNLAIVGAAGVYGSTIESYKLTVAGQIINTASGVTTPIESSGTVPITAEVTDSRGRKSTFAVTNVTVLPYTPPTASPIEASRALSGGTINETDGTYIRVDMTAVVQSLINGTQKNLLQYRVSTSPYEANTWTVRIPTTSVGASTLAFNSFSTPFPYILLDAGPPNYFPINAPFDIKVEIIDKLNTAVIIRSVAQGQVLVDFNGNSGVGFGGYHQGLGKLEVWGGDIYQDGLPVVDFGDTATTSLPGIVRLPTNSEAVAGTSTALAMTPANVRAAVGQLNNIIINGGFRTNQRAYVSAASLALGAYGFDRWKATAAATTLTFTSSIHGQALTINSGKGIQQIVERENVPPGEYTLAWEGTATARVYNVGATAPAYAASPITVTLDGAANVAVEFTASGSSKTINKVQLVAGANPSVFVNPKLVDEIRYCQRYFWRLGVAPGDSIGSVCVLAQWNSSTAYGVLFLPASMRATPVLSYPAGSSLYRLNLAGAGYDNDDITISYFSGTSQVELRFIANGNVLGTSGKCGWMRLQSAAAWLDFDAEL